MKKILSAILNFFFLIFNFRKLLNIKKAKQKLTTAIKNQRVDKIILKHLINQDLRKCLKVDARSNYIPLTNKNKAEIILMIKARHGKQMEYLNIEITDDLRLI
jgi:hypothetical protein